MFIPKSSIAAGLLALGAVCAGSAHAADVHWSIGINLPPVGTVISNAPAYHAYPAYPAYPVYQAPRPVYGPPPVVVYQPVPRVVYAPGYYGRGGPRHDWRHDRRDDYGRYDRHDRRGHHDDHRDGRRDDRRR